MEKDSGINVTSKTGVVEILRNREPMIRILFVIPGLIGLSGSIEILQNIARTSTNDITDRVFVDNWIPWLAVLFFAVGWFTVYWVETAMVNRRTRTVVILFIVLLLEGIVSGIYFHYFIAYEMLHRFGLAVWELIASGALLRYSTFSKDALIAQRKILSGEKIETFGQR